MRIRRERVTNPLRFADVVCVSSLGDEVEDLDGVGGRREDETMFVRHVLVGVLGGDT